MIRIFLMILYFFCMTANAQSSKSSDAVVYTQDKLGISMTATRPELVIQLKSNPTTGYRWFLREYDSSLMAPVKHTMVAANDKNLMGAPGYELWTFRMKPAAFLVPQQTILRFVYARPWDGADQSTQLVFRVSTM